MRICCYEMIQMNGASQPMVPRGAKADIIKKIKVSATVINVK